MRLRNKYLKDTKTFSVTVDLHKPSLTVNVYISSVSNLHVTERTNRSYPRKSGKLRRSDCDEDLQA